MVSKSFLFLLCYTFASFVSSPERKKDLDSYRLLINRGVWSFDGIKDLNWWVNDVGPAHSEPGTNSPSIQWCIPGTGKAGSPQAGQGDAEEGKSGISKVCFLDLEAHQCLFILPLQISRNLCTFPSNTTLRLPISAVLELPGVLSCDLI